MTKSYLGELPQSHSPAKSQSGPNRREQRRGHSQPPSLRKPKPAENLADLNLPIRKLKEHFRKGKPISKPAPQRGYREITVLRKTLSLSQKSLIIKARFGSFSDFSRPKLTYSNIARAFHLPPSTV